MRPTVFQRAELRDENDNIVQQGTYGKGSALSNSTNNGWVDYVMNNLEALYGIAKDEVVPVASLPASGDTNKTYLLTTTGVCYRWDGTEWVEISSSEAVGRAEAAADLAEEWATKTSGTVADNEYSAKYYANSAQQSADDAQDVADDMADHLAQIDQNTGGVSANSKRIGNIEKLLQGNLYDYDTDDDTAYTKTVPSGAMPYAGLEKVGGKTIVYNQLCNFPASATISGLTFTKNSDNMYTVNGTSTDSVEFSLSATINIPTTHQILVKGCPVGGSTTGSAMFFLRNAYERYLNNHADIGNGYIYTNRVDTRVYLRFECSAGVTFNNAVLKPFMCDLTLMFGAGNEPSTTAEVEAMFPAETYPFSTGTLLSAGVTSVVSKDGNNATLQTYSIPAEVQALEGYGWSVSDTVYNYVDFERKVFVKRVGSVDMGTLTYVAGASYNGFFFSDIVSDMKSPVMGGEKGFFAKYATYFGTVGDFTTRDKCVWIAPLNVTATPKILIKDSSYTYDSAGAASFKTAMNGVYLYYELATPVETDISEYLTDDNLINVESGGTLTFENQHGDDYLLPVPSEETYMIDLQEAINNG